MCALTVHPARLLPGALVVVQDVNCRWTARLVNHAFNPDGEPNGVSFVEVIDAGGSYWRAGLVVAAVTMRLRRVVDTYPADCSCRWQYRAEQGDWVILAVVADCPHHHADAAPGPASAGQRDGCARS